MATIDPIRASHAYVNAKNRKSANFIDMQRALGRERPKKELPKLEATFNLPHAHSQMHNYKPSHQNLSTKSDKYKRKF